MKNREIKFRAWNNEKKHMVSKIGIMVADKYRWGFSVEQGLAVNPEIDTKTFSLMQYTGLKEHCNENPSDNREIYEGDVVELLNETLVVEWNDDICQFQFSDGTPINDGERYGAYKKIIGNAFENPDLLK